MPQGTRLRIPMCSPGRKQREVLANGIPDPPSYAGGGLWQRDGAQGQWVVPDSGILVSEVVVGGLSMVVAAVVVVVATVVVAMVVGATLGMVGTVVASVVAAVAVASVLLTTPVTLTVVRGNVGGAEREM